MITRWFLFLNAYDEHDMNDLFFGTEVRFRHCDNFLRQYARLIEVAIDCDPDRMLLDTIHVSAEGSLHHIFCDLYQQKGNACLRIFSIFRYLKRESYFVLFLILVFRKKEQEVILAGNCQPTPKLIVVIDETLFNRK